jgi:hypothetical protein
VAKKVPNACACFLRAGVHIIVLMSANLETLAVHKFATKEECTWEVLSALHGI